MDVSRGRNINACACVCARVRGTVPRVCLSRFHRFIYVFYSYESLRFIFIFSSIFTFFCTRIKKKKLIGGGGRDVRGRAYEPRTSPGSLVT